MPAKSLRPDARAVFVVALALSASCSCAAAPSGVRGAPTSTPTPSGPTSTLSPALPTLVARVTPSPTKTHSTAPARSRQLASAIAAALKSNPVPPVVKVSQKSAAGDQVVVSWTVSDDPNDRGARERVRENCRQILAIVKADDAGFGSVLLMATGAVLVEGKRKVSIVVRAKYTRPLVLATDWPTVPTARILLLPDDKPAVIDPAYR